MLWCSGKSVLGRKCFSSAATPLIMILSVVQKFATALQKMSQSLHTAARHFSPPEQWSKQCLQGDGISTVHPRVKTTHFSVEPRAGILFTYSVRVSAAGWLDLYFCICACRFDLFTTHICYSNFSQKQPQSICKHLLQKK